MLSDSGSQIAEQLGVVTAPSPDALEAPRSHGLDLAERNADGTTELPMPTTVIVDRNHVVRRIDIHPDSRRDRSRPRSSLQLGRCERAALARGGRGCALAADRRRRQWRDMERPGLNVGRHEAR